MEQFVDSLILRVLEKSGDCHKKIGVLLTQLVNKNILLKNQFVKGLQVPMFINIFFRRYRRPEAG
jgi:hypothetical protein